MDSQKNIELPNIGGGFSNNHFEGSNFENRQNREVQNSADNFNIDAEKSREAVFSTFDKFSIQGETRHQNIPPITNQSLPSVDRNDTMVHVPATAQDIDLMEDEWVKDLKKMITETKNDPHTREVRFKQMQMDYLKKRYNRIIGGGK